MLRAREVGWALLVIVLALGLFWLDTDAAGRRAERLSRQDEREAAVRLLGTADLFLSSSSRWIRHPSLSESGAAFQEHPAALDVDPAGGVIGPSVKILGAGNRNRLILRRER